MLCRLTLRAIFKRRSILQAVAFMPVRLTVLAILTACCLALCGGCSTAKSDPDYSFSDPRVLTLLRAIDREDLAEIDQLVAAGVDVNAVGQSNAFRGVLNATPLTWAFGEKKAAFKRLLELGADPNQVVNGHGTIVRTAAAHQSDSEWLQMVLDYHGSPDLDGPLRFTPLFHAVSSQRVESLRLLINAGANINHESWLGTPLIWAARTHWLEGAYYLLEAGADYRLGVSPNLDLAYYVIENPVEHGNVAWQWREKVIDSLEADGVDFEPAYQLVEQEDPPAAKLWQEHMQRRAEEKHKRGDKPK
jgi:ankyrin repeat protein